MLSSPEIKCLEDAGFPDKLCFKKPAGAFFAIKNGCGMMGKLYGHTDITHSSYQYGYTSYSTQGWYTISNLANMNDVNLNRMFHVIKKAEMYYNSEKEPSYDEVETALEKFFEKNISHSNHPDFLRNTNLCDLRKAYLMLRQNRFYLPQSVRTGHGQSYYTNEFYVKYEFDTKTGEITNRVFPDSVTTADIPSEFRSVGVKIFVKNKNDYDKPVDVTVIDRNIPWEILPDPDPKPINTGGYAGERYIYYTVKCILAVVPKNTSWCGPLNSGT